MFLLSMFLEVQGKNKISFFGDFMGKGNYTICAFFFFLQISTKILGFKWSRELSEREFFGV